MLRAWLGGRFELVTSREQLAELARVLDYPRLRSRVLPEQKHDFLNHIEALADLAVDLPTLDVSPDPSDNVILAAAVAGRAHLVVSGDFAGMLALKDVRGVPIVSVSEALRRLGADPQ